MIDTREMFRTGTFLLSYSKGGRPEEGIDSGWHVDEVYDDASAAENDAIEYAREIGVFDVLLVEFSLAHGLRPVLWCLGDKWRCRRIAFVDLPEPVEMAAKVLENFTKYYLSVKQ